MPLGEAAQAALAVYLETARPTLMRGKLPSPALFVTDHGGPMTRQHFFFLIKSLRPGGADRPPGHAPHPAPLVRHASAGRRGRPAHHPGDARPRQRRDHPALHPRGRRPPPRRLRQDPPPRLMRYNSDMSSTDALQAQIQDEIAQVIAILEDITSLTSRWTGRVLISEDESFRGKMIWNGDIAVKRSVVPTDLRWRTSIHEALHTFSHGLKPGDYSQLPGWEEGIVEGSQRLLRPSILARLNVRVNESTFQPAEARHEYNRYINALESMRLALNAPHVKFYLDLLAVALKDRPQYVIEKGQERQGQKFKDFQRRFALAFTILRGD